MKADNPFVLLLYIVCTIINLWIFTVCFMVV